MIGFILNIPYTIVGLMIALVSVPTGVKFRTNPYAFIINIKKFWWAIGYIKNMRAMAFGNLILLGPNLENKDIEHELIHVEQFQRIPLLLPVLYYIESIKKGYKNNKYEIEAYQKARNVYKDK